MDDHIESGAGLLKIAAISPANSHHRAMFKSSGLWSNLPTCSKKNFVAFVKKMRGETSAKKPKGAGDEYLHV